MLKVLISAKNTATLLSFISSDARIKLVQAMTSSYNQAFTTIKGILDICWKKAF